MEKNRKRFLDKVVEFLVKDTIIDYLDNFHIYFPFFPEYGLYINDANLDYFFHKGRYTQYCKDTYGLTHEESLYVWGIYIKIIKEKIKTNGESLNESDDRRKNFLDKVVDFLVKDTKVDYEDRQLFFPFTQKRSTRRNTDNSTPFHKIIFDKDSIIPLGGFMEYIEEMYGITTREEISYVWGKYKDVMRYNVFGNDPTNEPIYESIEGKERILLDRILKYLIDDTIVDHDKGKVTFPFFLQVLPSMPKHCFNVNSTSSLSFSQYCKYTYGLNDDEVIYLYSKYKKLFSDKVHERNSINESDDRKQKYLDKILKWFVDDTIINYKTEIIYYPFSSIGPTGNRLPSFFDNIKNKLSMTYPSDIHIYCRDTYGLNRDETKYIWDNYKKIIRDRYDKESMMYHRGEPINESDDKKQVYLDKVVDWLVGDTIIDFVWEEGTVRFPYLPVNFTLSQLLNHKNTFFGKTPIYAFTEYCDTYGLTKDEIDYVWKIYVDIIWDKYNKESEINDYNLMNESDDKKQEYLNKVVDWLVRDTEIGNEYWFSPPYYYPGSSAGRTGFRTVYEHTFGLLKNTSYSGLDTQLIYFNDYCKNNYGLTEDEIDYVWMEYMEKLYESNKWRF
jgi:hypothetical protein